MRLHPSLVFAPLVGLVLACSDGANPAEPGQPALAAVALSGFGFNGTVSGAPTGVVRLTGGGSFDPTTATNTVPAETAAPSASGGFDCTAPVAQGPLAGCGAGEGVRWDTAQLLASSPFRCTGADAVKTATTDGRTAVLRARFFRAGDGQEPSFTAAIFVADRDLAPDLPGVQNVWVQGVGCGTANVHFN